MIDKVQARRKLASGHRWGTAAQDLKAAAIP